MFYLLRMPTVIRYVFPSRLWSLPNDQKTVHLTFDDGPVPFWTPLVLSLLEEHNFKATFFCVGDNIRKHPQLFKDILARGHAVGNHTYHHLRADQHHSADYLKDVLAWDEEVSKHQVQTSLFRPPHGRLSAGLSQQLNDKKIVMWSLLSGDFDTNIDCEQRLEAICKKTRAGDIIVFHDSEKAGPQLKVILPDYLKYLSDNGFHSKILD
ncbi:MAG: polysaccharide deacetylase family protein [Cyclobacteriaceae bacterium]|nr:polysaccharide deacetylase family protein [Cyclobacteriaceae bacterium]MCH8516678.1 polysaccharide deacetylase family protein [Cyclobacteriaceae bacterium]